MQDPNGSARLPPWQGEVVERIHHLRGLEQNWDSYGASPVDPHLADAVSGFLSSPLWVLTPQPSIVPTPQGGLAVEWQLQQVTFHLEFDPQGPVTVYVSDDDSKVEWEGSLTRDQSV